MAVADLLALAKRLTEPEPEREMRPDRPAEPPPTIRPLLDRRSLQLYFLQRRHPQAPLFPGALTEWPHWYLHDARQIDMALADAQGDRQTSRDNLALAKTLEAELEKGAR